MSTSALLLLAIPATSLAQSSNMAVSNVQLMTGATQAVQTLNVTENDGLTQAVGQALGNQMMGGNDGVNAALTSSQALSGNVGSIVEINGVNTGDEDISLGTPIYATTQANGNYAAFTTANASASNNATQQSTAAQVEARTAISAPNNAAYGPDQTTGDANATVNDTSYQVTNGRLDSQMVQTSSTEALANTSVTMHYSPSPEVYTAEATNNYYGAYSDQQGSQAHNVQQTVDGQTVSRSELYGGNVWNPTVQSTAIGNNTNVVNAGGSLDVTDLQNQTATGYVQSQAYLSADQWSTANVQASGIGNSVTAGNNDVTVHLDNTQVSSGGVDVSAEFVGNSGYDGYVTADAIGNQAIAYACSECQAQMGVTNNQTNNSDVSATATSTVTNGRSIVSTAHATGNSATFYVSR